MQKTERRSSQLKKILSIASDHLAGTLAHAANLQRLQPLVYRALPTDLAAHCRPGNLRGNTLVIHADSPAWAAKMRFHAPQLIRSLQRANDLSGLERCEVRVLPQTTAPSASKSTPSAISATSREQLRSAARGLKDPRLKEAFERLADGENRPK
jgi:hypothetical protein